MYKLQLFNDILELYVLMNFLFIVQFLKVILFDFVIQSKFDLSGVCIVQFLNKILSDFLIDFRDISESLKVRLDDFIISTLSVKLHSSNFIRLWELLKD